MEALELKFEVEHRIVDTPTNGCVRMLGAMFGAVDCWLAGWLVGASDNLLTHFLIVSLSPVSLVAFHLIVVVVVVTVVIVVLYLCAIDSAVGQIEPIHSIQT